jgi:hypothetical protein
MRDTGDQKPFLYTLEQNYPNPFNPETEISFSILSRSIVSLSVFDMLGREVAVLAKGELAAGAHKQRWNASGCASGVYFCRLIAGNYNATRKLILAK